MWMLLRLTTILETTILDSRYNVSKIEVLLEGTVKITHSCCNSLSITASLSNVMFELT